MTVSNRNISESKYRGAGFTGKWLDSFGNVPDYGVWFIYGNSGSGKTTFVLQLAKYLTTFGNVFFDSLEMAFLSIKEKSKTSPDLKIAWDRVGMIEVENKINANTEQLDELRMRLQTPRSPKIIIIDSLKYIRLSKTKRRVKFDELVDFFSLFPDKLFVIIGHSEGNSPRGGMGVDMEFHASVKVYVEGYKAFVRTRFPLSEDWESEPYIIWDKGANEYHLDKI
jgi:molybdopterin-guanine dinucleotide biosynthesis protein